MYTFSGRNLVNTVSPPCYMSATDSTLFLDRLLSLPGGQASDQLQGRGSPRWSPTSGAAAILGKLLEMQIIGPTTDLLNQKARGGAQHSVTR